MERNILFQDASTVQKSNAISSCTYSGNAAFLNMFQTELFPQTHPMLIELYVLEAKNIQINKVPADRLLLPKDQAPNKPQNWCQCRDFRLQMQ